MEDQQRIREALLRLDSDLVFLMHEGVISRRFQEDSSRYIDKSYAKYTSHETHTPLQADQTPLRPSSPSLIDIDDRFTDDNFERRPTPPSTVPSASTADEQPSPQPQHSYPTSSIDLDRHESDAAAEWLGRPSSEYLLSMDIHHQSTGAGTSSISASSAHTAGIFANGAAASKSSDSKRRRERRARARGRRDHDDDRRRTPQQPELRQSRHAPTSPAEPWMGTGHTRAGGNGGLPGGPDRMSANLSAVVPQQHSTICCPFWLTFGSCRQASCRFVHDMVPGRPREKLECAFWRTVKGCVRGDCGFEHHATAHGLQGEGRRGGG
ncbi:hypothetical protein NKR19_g7959 [Coniochaeta hoffmannii]|uniref:C3H1-type domain-containing protein n=1 Tax=Coniochaeta hoffmannii TaxID=91930 RepID=A0AA38VP14_9PEZI|nr:hypothetical protein NKR19_g7959 [Coniochaeta hoffmannii]